MRAATDENRRNKARSIKVVVIGDSAVGKTCIINIANTGEVGSKPNPTVGACFVVNKYTFGDTQIKLNIWDTAGQERYRSLAPMYYHDMNVAIVVYAIDSIESFRSVDQWVDGIHSEFEKMPKLYLIGNKTDLEENRKISNQDGYECAQRIGATFIETTTQQPEIIIELFKRIAEQAAQEQAHQPEQPKLVEIKETEEKSSCCK
ncbi:small GTP-binding protein [Histomonas meleagridis]|uniref:small GTP-binding protein n=1 Tax=Histomonas meleagridis TaxID=135588 RepID=UPI0035598086|nr:small GTP-binding protein [Histomonas meleagridis]KAH0805606.1 small GTP-binding protein [Histomonas meleagridis]